MRRIKRVGVVAGAMAAAALAFSAGPAAAVDLSLPSLWQAYQNDFTIGTFGNWNSPQALYHFRSNAIPNNLKPTTANGQAEQILQSIEAYNAANHLTDATKKVVRGHVFAWHGGQQPNWFFCNGFTYNATNPDWASPATMLKRLDNYIHAMMDKYAKYSDVIVSWDVVNEAVDDYSGQIRNGQDAQVSQWGRIFRRPDLDSDPDAR